MNAPVKFIQASGRVVVPQKRGILDFFKRRPVRNPNDDPTRLLIMRTGPSTVKSVTYQQAINAEQAMIHPVVYRCIDKIATAVEMVDWYVRKVDKKGRDKTLGGKLEDVLGNPNNYMTAGELRYWMGMSRAVFGRIPFKVGVGTDGKPNAIYPLKPSHFETKLSDRGIVTGYLYGAATGSEKETLPTRDKATGDTPGSAKTSYAAEIIRPNLSGSPVAKGYSTPLDSIGYPAEIINLLLKRAIDSASGHPNSKYIIGTEKTLTPEQNDEIKDSLDETTPGGDDGGNILILSNTKLDVHELNNNLGDIHAKMPMDDMARHIAGSFGIPISLLGLSAQDGAKFAGNYMESRRSFWEDTIIPGYLIPIAQGMTKAMCDEGWEIVFDIDTIPALEEVKADRAKKLEDVTFLDDDEKREMCGFPPMTEAQKADAKARRDKTPVNPSTPTPKVV